MNNSENNKETIVNNENNTENEPVGKRIDFVYVFDVQDGNPNGDPDAANAPRVDPNGFGIVTDVCLKRKIRNYVELSRGNEEGHEIFVHNGVILNCLIDDAANAIGAEFGKKTKVGKQKLSDRGSEDVRAELCRRYFDVRAFGAVLTTGIDAGRVVGPVQLTFARSADPVEVQRHSITRCCVTKEEDADKESTIGEKYTVPYGLYVAHGFVTPAFAAKTGFSADDLNLVWKALVNMFDVDRASSRGLMSARKLVVFHHDTPIGRVPAHTLFDRVHVALRDGVETPSSYSDYDVSVSLDGLPEGVMAEVVA